MKYKWIESRLLIRLFNRFNSQLPLTPYVMSLVKHDQTRFEQIHFNFSSCTIIQLLLQRKPIWFFFSIIAVFSPFLIIFNKFLFCSLRFNYKTAYCLIAMHFIALFSIHSGSFVHSDLCRNGCKFSNIFESNFHKSFLQR